MTKKRFHYSHPRQWKPYHLYIEHIKNFMQQADLCDSISTAYVAVSGGLDSMALLFILSQLKKMGVIANLSAIHINHGTRVSCQEEEALVQKFCLELKIPLIIKSLKLDLELKNFEHQARQKRYEIFAEIARDENIVYTGHHIDDSFEWSQLQQFKSSHQNAVLGIPVKRGVYRRPFLCLTKAQIERFVRAINIPYREDLSNDNIRFERNYLRREIIPAIKKRFPKYLKHYVTRSNIEAQKRNLSVFKNYMAETEIKTDGIGGVALINLNLKNNFAGQEEKIIKIIQSLSDVSRGTLAQQIQKMIAAAQQGKKGPLSFSGGVYGYIEQGLLYFVNKKSLEKIKQLDLQLLILLKENRAQVPNQYNLAENFELLNLPFEHLVFPYFCIEGNAGHEKKGQSLKTPHNLWPKATGYALQYDITMLTLGKYKFSKNKKSKKQLWLPLFNS